MKKIDYKYFSYAISSILYTDIMVLCINIISPFRDIKKYQYLLPDTQKYYKELWETAGWDVFILVPIWFVLYFFIIYVLTLYKNRYSKVATVVKYCISNLIFGIPFSVIGILSYLIIHRFVLITFLFFIDLYTK